MKEEEDEEQQETAAGTPAAESLPPAEASLPPLPISLQLRGFATLPVPLPPSLLPQAVPSRLTPEDEEMMESIFRLSAGTTSLPPCEPPLPSASWDEEEEKERKSFEGTRKSKAANTRPMPSGPLRRGKRIRTPTRPSSSTFPSAAEPVHALKPRVLSPMPLSASLFPPPPSPFPSSSSPRARSTLQGGGEGGGGQVTEGEMAKSRDSSPALDRCEQVEEAVMSEVREPKEEGGAEEETGGGGLPLVVESDLDFLIDFFDAEK